MRLRQLFFVKQYISLGGSMILKDFPYVVVPEWTGGLQEDVCALLTANRLPKTLIHVQNVSAACAEIAGQYGLDREICIAAGLLHDVGAVIHQSDMPEYARKHGFSLCEAEIRYPFLLNQRISRVMAEEYFGIADERILSAIECHTTLKKQASKEDMALFLADKLAWDQEGTPPFYDLVRGALKHSLEEACLRYMKYMEESGGMLYPHV